MSEWGKDHWSLLLYVETRCVDYNGTLDFKHMRDKLMRGDVLLNNKWKPEYGTRLKGYFVEGGENDKSRQLPQHDDHDCLEDLEAAMLIKNIGTGMNPLITMTDLGYTYITQLRKHKAAGGHCSNFEPAV